MSRKVTTVVLLGLLFWDLSLFGAKFFHASPEASESVLTRLEHHKQTRLVIIDAEALSTLLSAGIGISDVVLNPFDTIEFETVVTRVDTSNPESSMVSGRLQGLPGSYFAVSEVSGIVGVVISDPGSATYVVRHQRDGVYEIAEIDAAVVNHGDGEGVEADLIRYHEPLSFKAFRPLSLQAVAAQVEASTNKVSVVDVLMVYTDEAVAGAGGEAELNSIISLALLEANTAYQNSKAKIRLREVFRSRVDYEEHPSLSTNLNRLRVVDDGFLDEVHGLRDEHNADLVCMFVEQGDAGFGGLGFTMSDPSVNFESFGFTLVKQSAAVGTYTLAHELSHNMGCQHQRTAAVDINGEFLSGAFPYSHGFRFELGGTPIRTVMAVGEGQRIPFFSNPTIVFQGTPIGISESDTNNAADNTLSLNNTAAIAAAFRAPLEETSPPTVQMTAPEDGLVVTAGSSLTFVANVEDTDGEVVLVEFYRDDQLVGLVGGEQIIDGMASLVLSDIAPGVSDVTARVFDDISATSVALPISIIVRPRGDDFATAIQLEGESVEIEGSVIAATMEAGEPTHSANPGSNSIWFRWKAPRNGSVELTTQGSGVIPVPIAYVDAELLALEGLPSSLSFGGSSDALLGFDAVEGQEFRFVVYGFQDREGAFTLRLNYKGGPGNDDFENSELLPGDDVLNFSGTNNGALLQDGEPVHAGNPGGKSVWYTWASPKTGVASVIVSASAFRPLVDVYQGNQLDQLSNPARSFSFIDENVDGEVIQISKMLFDAVSGVDYRFAVDGLGGSGEFDFELVFPAAPINDLFASPSIIAGPVVEISSDNSFSTFEAEEPMHSSNRGGKSVWYSWSAPLTTPVTLMARSETYLPLVGVYTGASLGGLNSVIRTALFSDDQRELVLTFNAEASEVYRIAVDGLGNQAGPFTLSLASEFALPRLFSEPEPAFNDDNQFRFTLQGSSGGLFAVDVSNDLVNWSELLLGTFEGETFEVLDVESAGQSIPARFYRIRAR